MSMAGGAEPLTPMGSWHVDADRQTQKYRTSLLVHFLTLPG